MPQADRPVVLYGTTVGTTAEHFLRGQLRWVREHGFDVHLATSPDEGAAGAAAEQGATYHGLPMAREVDLRQDPRSLVQWLRLIRRLQPDVVNMSTPKAGLLGLTAAWLLRVPRRVYVVRGVRYEGATGPKRRLLQTMERVALCLATDVVSVSHSVREVLERDGLVSADGCVVIGAGSSNGVDVERVVGLAGEGARRPEVEAARSAGALVVGAVGRMVPDKGLTEIGRALTDPRCRQMHLVTVGGAGEDMPQEYRLLAEQGRWTHVEWTENAPREMAGFDVLLHASHREGFPNVVLEAAALGVPTVASDVTGNRDAVVDGVTGLRFPKGDHQAIARCLVAMTDPELRARTGRAAAERVRSEFRPGPIWDGLVRIYREGLSGWRSR